MKIPGYFFVIFCVAALYGSVSAQEQKPAYDSLLAKKLGADERGMKMYVLVILKTGDNTTTDKKFKDSCFAGHFSNMGRMVKEGKLIVAGPLEKNDKTYRGIFILDCPMAEVNELMQSDPAIHARLLATEVYEWYGSAALPLYLESVDKIRPH